ncbi:dTDP-4-dehydrorhamnose reductase family protein [Micromonospora sp. NPDC000089]|uniref:dTDP-4-dehydrorhamnose reductase family protein n=1 Tax=unclassified Micromonospora TaxID=2617518 RepID=UPI0036AB966B
MRQRVLILGAGGMLGHTLLREFDKAEEIDVHGCVRALNVAQGTLPAHLSQKVVQAGDVTRLDPLRRVLSTLEPDVVINCVGVIKQRPEVDDAATTVAVNALFPHVLARECRAVGSRVIQISTDCVFSGHGGGYRETDPPDPGDLYGRAKLLGETTRENALTLRTSIVGHEIGSNRSLVDWFLSQTGRVTGYRQAIYSGLTTTEFAVMLRTVVLPRPHLAGLYHVASAPISKYELLRVIADVYGWAGVIEPSDEYRCDRSLRAEKFHAETGYTPPEWPAMIGQLQRAAAEWGLPVARLSRTPALT